MNTCVGGVGCNGYASNHYVNLQIAWEGRSVWSQGGGKFHYSPLLKETPDDITV